VDRVGVLHTVNADLPSASQTGPDSAILLGHSPAFSDEALVPAACEEVVVIAQQDAAGRCLLLAESSSAAVSYHVTRHRRSMQTNTWEPVARTEEARLPRPGTGGRKRAQSLLFRLLSGLKSANAALEPLLRDAARSTHASYKATASPESKGAVLLMCINSGNLDLLLNFLRSTCDRGIDVGNLVVFAADAEVEVALRFAGIRTFSHDALGTFTSTAARSYGDHTFVEIMWLKSTCVYLVNALGYDLIFQDADLFWWSDPWPILAKRPELDTAWMDDGARTTRFAPHFMNTGFYLVRANRRTQLYTAQMLGHHDIVLAWQSHQAVVSQLAAEAQALHGMTVQILDQECAPTDETALDAKCVGPLPRASSCITTSNSFRRSARVRFFDRAPACPRARIGAFKARDNRFCSTCAGPRARSTNSNT